MELVLKCFSGLIVGKLEGTDNSTDNVHVDVGEFHPEVVTHSGKAYVYFYSDASYIGPGFLISYRLLSRTRIQFIHVSTISFSSVLLKIILLFLSLFFKFNVAYKNLF